MIDAIVLASGPPSPEFDRAFGNPYKATIDIAGTPMVRRVVGSLLSSSAIANVVVVGEPNQLRPTGIPTNIVSGFGPAYTENISAGLHAVRSDPVLVLACDVPLARPESLTDFVNDSIEQHADVTFPVVSLEAMEQELPGARKTWYSLRDGTYTKGNAVVARREFLIAKAERIERLHQRRKRKRWAGDVGRSFCKRLLMGRLTLDDVVMGLSRYLRAFVAAVPSHPEIAVDVDAPGDVTFASDVLMERSEEMGHVLLCAEGGVL